MKKLFFLIAFMVIPINAEGPDLVNSCLLAGVLIGGTYLGYKYFTTHTTNATPTPTINNILKQVDSMPKEEANNHDKLEDNNAPISLTNNITTPPPIIDQKNNNIEQLKDPQEILKPYIEKIKEKIKQKKTPNDILNKVFVDDKNLDILSGY